MIISIGRRDRAARTYVRTTIVIGTLTTNCKPISMYIATACNLRSMGNWATPRTALKRAHPAQLDGSKYPRMGDHNARFIKRYPRPPDQSRSNFRSFFPSCNRGTRARRIENDGGAERSIIMKWEGFTFGVEGFYFMPGDYHRKAILVLTERTRANVQFLDCSVLQVRSIYVPCASKFSSERSVRMLKH